MPFRAPLDLNSLKAPPRPTEKVAYSIGFGNVDGEYPGTDCGPRRAGRI